MLQADILEHKETQLKAGEKRIHALEQQLEALQARQGDPRHSPCHMGGAWLMRAAQACSSSRASCRQAVAAGWQGWVNDAWHFEGGQAAGRSLVSTLYMPVHCKAPAAWPGVGPWHGFQGWDGAQADIGDHTVHACA